MAYGIPYRMEDVLPYLQGISECKPVPDYAIKENTEKYAMSNGISPSNAIIDRIVERLEKELSAYGQFNVILGNKHWNPTLSDALMEAMKSGSDRIIAVPLFPFESTNVRDSYLEPTLSAMESIGFKADVKFVNGFSPEEVSLDLPEQNEHARRVQPRCVYHDSEVGCAHAPRLHRHCRSPLQLLFCLDL